MTCTAQFIPTKIIYQNEHDVWTGFSCCAASKSGKLSSDRRDSAVGIQTSHVREIPPIVCQPMRRLSSRLSLDKMSY